MKEFLIRCSSLSSIMADSVSYPRENMNKLELEALACKKRTPEQIEMLDAVMARTLSAGAKTEIHRQVRYFLFNYEPPQLGGKEIRKGIMQEQSAIELMTMVRGGIYEKNTERLRNEWISGEPDLIADDHGADTKCPWSLETFPLTVEHARKQAIAAGYDWQARGYMMLTDCNRWSIDYCMVDTPSELLPPFEDTGPHEISHIPLEKRITSVTFERDLKIEERIKLKCVAAKNYALELISQFELEHS